MPDSDSNNSAKEMKDIDLTSFRASGEYLGFEGILSGSLIADRKDFKNKTGKEISCTPIIVDFRRILQCCANTGSADIVSGVSTNYI